ncbi:MAG: exonuclease domain-containing protein, partial [Myxococcales bacterium]|nr:exonuclease domain-containing protein [Myxococcales bacterium]
MTTDERSLRVQSLAPSEVGLDAEVFARFAAGIGSFAVVDLETTGLGADAELLEVGALLVDPGEQNVQTLSVLLRPERPLPRAIERLTGITQALADGGAVLAEVAPSIGEHLAGRTLLAHNADFERSFLSRCVDPALGDAVYLDTLDLLSVTHPDAPDLRLETFTRLLLGHEESHRGLDDALDTARVMSAAGVGAAAGEARYVVAARALEAFAPESPWLSLLGKEVFPAPLPETSGYVEIGPTDESPTPFDFDAIEAVLRDEARGRRHFQGYRVREEQIRLARAFARNLADDEILLLEGGTGVGKSLAYLAAAIPFAVERAEEGEKSPVLISTRTRLLQDQLLGKDIGAAARFLGYPDLRALSIKGRANYACARRLAVALSRGREPSVFPEQRLAYSVLEACARTRRNGEIGTVPAALLRRFPPLREMLRRSVAARSEQCTREQCASERWCPLGRRRSALAGAHLVVANHDLMLRWPVDYPAFGHVIADEAHELGGVADEAYSLEVRPDEVLERFDELFGRPRGGRRPKRGEALVPQTGAGARRDVVAWRRELAQDLSALGRALQDEAGDFGDVQIPESPGPEYSAARRLAESAADRMDHLADHAEEEGESGMILDRAVADLRGWAEALRLPLAGER